ncbi:RNA polymerase sigma factor [uncultured Adlercreutzia sp.]|uniref:RNA polymerase sigma factor n=1 Tax=uncultured Adlercreutzia sp. TaxID=875803 RepID=UPI0026F3C626|nr:sigma-70 family RNA polymerase sigma factor [uncultured Adlercreutzia sp.]
MELSPHSALASLVVRAQRGDQQAFTELYRRTAQVQYFTIVSKVGEARADDILQDVYLTAWRNIDKIKPQAVVAYLNSVTRNLCLKHIRDSRGASAPVALPDEDLETLGHRPLGPASNPENFVVDRDSGERLRRALRAYLTDEERELLLMRYYQRLKMPEIAEQTGLSLSTVKRRINQALETLREKMGVAFLPLGLSGALARAVEHPLAPGVEGRPSGEEQVLQRMSQVGAVVVAGGAAVAVAAAVMAPAPVEPLPEEEPPLVAPEKPQDTAAPTVVSQAVEDGVIVVVVADDRSGVAGAWCVGEDGAEHLPLDEAEAYENDAEKAAASPAAGGDGSADVDEPTARGEGSDNFSSSGGASAGTSEPTARPGEPSSVPTPQVRSFRFALESGTYELHLTDGAGNHTSGPLEAQLYPEP